MAPASALPLCIEAAAHATLGASIASKIRFGVSLHLGPQKEHHDSMGAAARFLSVRRSIAILAEIKLALKLALRYAAQGACALVMLVVCRTHQRIYNTQLLCVQWAFAACNTALANDPEALGDVLATQGRIHCIYGDFAVRQHLRSRPRSSMRESVQVHSRAGVN